LGWRPVTGRDGAIPRSARARATGASLIASGLVPMTSPTSPKCSHPPSSAGEACLHYGRSSTKIVGVGLDLEPHWRRGHDVIGKAVALAISDRRFLGREVHADLRPRVARTVPPGQRIGMLCLLPFELELPAGGIGLA